MMTSQYCGRKIILGYISLITAKVRTWSICTWPELQISKIQDGGRPPFWEFLRTRRVA